MTRKYAGNNPPDGKLISVRPGEWYLFERKSNERGWKAFKLVSIPPREKKANYHLAYDGTRLAEGYDAKVLAANMPEIHTWVMECLQSHGTQNVSPST